MVPLKKSLSTYDKKFFTLMGALSAYSSAVMLPRLVSMTTMGFFPWAVAVVPVMANPSVRKIPLNRR